MGFMLKSCSRNWISNNFLFIFFVKKIPILKSYRNDHDKRNFVSGGAGAGVIIQKYNLKLLQKIISFHIL